MEAELEPFREAYAQEQTWVVAQFLSPLVRPEDAGRLYNFVECSNEHHIEGDIRYALKYSKRGQMNPKEIQAWTDIFVSYWRAISEILRAEEASVQGRLGERQLVSVYEAWKQLSTAIMKYISNGDIPSWNIVVMYISANYLRVFAIKADEQLAKLDNPTTTAFSDDIVSTGPRNVKLEEAARVFNRMFSLCLGDRNPDLKESRKWGAYYLANLQFKTYFKLNAISLSKNIVQSINATVDLPDFELFPKAHRTAYKYYTGVLAFLQEDYPKAEQYLTEAWDLCYADSKKNQELILTYLIPCRLITKHSVPTVALLSPFPRLERILTPIVACIKKGDLTGFDNALVAAENELVKRRIYLTLERGRDIALRNLLRKVFLAQGFEDLKEGQTEADRIRKSRVPIAHFAAALRMGMSGEGSGQVLDDDEVECMLANMIYKGLMKGYISRDHGMVVLHKKGAFPGTGV